jgi:hypothetical protein
MYDTSMSSATDVCEYDISPYDTVKYEKFMG